VYKQARAGMQARVYNMRIKNIRPGKEKNISRQKKKRGRADSRDTLNSRFQDLIFMLAKAPNIGTPDCDKN